MAGIFPRPGEREDSCHRSACRFGALSCVLDRRVVIRRHEVVIPLQPAPIVPAVDRTDQVAWSAACTFQRVLSSGVTNRATGASMSGLLQNLIAGRSCWLPWRG